MFPFAMLFPNSGSYSLPADLGTLYSVDQGQASPRTVSAWMRVLGTGEVSKREDTGPSLVVTTIGNWSSNAPNEDNGSAFSFRVVYVSGTEHDISVAANQLDTWYTADGIDEWLFVTPATSGAYDETGTYQLELSSDGGSTTIVTREFDVRLRLLAP